MGGNLQRIKTIVATKKAFHNKILVTLKVKMFMGHPLDYIPGRYQKWAVIIEMIESLAPFYAGNFSIFI
jgi:hypothetical protein